MRRMVKTIDSHTEGNPTRVIVGGVDVPPGETLLAKRDYLRDHDDGLRRMLNFEPRGSGLMCSVLLLPPAISSSSSGDIRSEAASVEAAFAVSILAAMSAESVIVTSCSSLSPAWQWGQTDIPG